MRFLIALTMLHNHVMRQNDIRARYRILSCNTLSRQACSPEQLGSRQSACALWCGKADSSRGHSEYSVGQRVGCRHWAGGIRAMQHMHHTLVVRKLACGHGWGPVSRCGMSAAWHDVRRQVSFADLQ